MTKNYSPGLFRTPEEFARLNEEEAKDDKHFPHIIDNEKHDEELFPVIVDNVPHKLPDLSNKYRKLLKESSSDELEQLKAKPSEDPYNEYEQKFSKDLEFDNHDMYSKNVNRSRSMLNRFNLNNNTTDSRKLSNNRVFANTLSKQRKAPKDDTSSCSPQRLLNISGNGTKKKV